MKVLLTALNAKFIHTNLAVRYLKKYTEDLNYECIIKEFSINDHLDNILESIINEEPQVVGFSCYIWNIEMVLKLSNLIKRIDKNIEILYGGPEVSYDSMDFLKVNEGDYVIEGEGEEAYRKFIQYKLEERSFEGIKGLYSKSHDSEVEFQSPSELMDMNKLIFPYGYEESFPNKIVYYEASRGCPFRCKYCLSSTIKGVRLRDIETVKKELQLLMDKKVALIKFVDRTFNADRKYAREIWEYVKDVQTETTFHFEISADLLKDEDVEMLSTIPKGRIQFEIGVQTTNPEVIKNIDRTMNLDRLKDVVKRLMKKDNINLHVDLIAGLPGEDFNSFKKSFNEVYSMGAHEVQLGFLKLLKGSPMRAEEEKWGMVYSPYPPYEILKNNDISYKEINALKRIEEMVDKYHNSGKFKNILKYFLYNYDNPVDFYHDLAVYFEDKGYFKRNISGVDYYKIFIDYSDFKFGNVRSIVEDIVKYDYLQFNKKNWLPHFLNRNISKEEEIKIKQLLIERDNIPSTKGVYIEGFNIDINEFISNNSIIKKRCYLIYTNEENGTKIFYNEEI